MANAIMAVKTMAPWKKFSLITFVAILLLVGVYCKLDKPKVAAQALNTTAVNVQSAKTMEVSSVLSFKANLEPIEKGIVGTKIAGQVVQILFDDGDTVAQGQQLVALDDKDVRIQLQSAEINLQKLQTTLDSSQRNYDRVKALFDSGAISKAAFEDAETAIKMAKSNIETAQVSILGINNSLNNLIICAPISGKIDEKNVSLGQYVTPGTILCKVLDTSSILAVIQIKQSDLAKVKVGQKANLKLSKNDTESYEGRIESIDVSANTASRVFNCQIRVDNKNAALRPGIFGYVELANDKKKVILGIPLSALVGTEDSYSVFTMDNGLARKHPVKIGEIRNDMVEITEGLKEGAKVIVTNLNSINDGDAVKVIGQGV